MIDKLLKLLKIKFAGEIPLKDGTMIMVEGDLAVGAMVYVQSPDGKMPLPDGDYELETGEILSCKDGKVEQITDVVDTTETPDITGAPPVGEVSVVEGAVPPVDEKPAEKPAEKPVTPDPEVEKLMGIVDELTKRLDAIEAKISMSAELDTKMEADLELIKTKTLVTELKKSKDVDDKIINRFDVIKNLKKNK